MWQPEGVENGRLPAHILGMADKRFSVRDAKGGNGYSVVYTPERGAPSEIGDFATETAANDWIAKESAAWLKKLEAGK